MIDVSRPEYRVGGIVGGVFGLLSIAAVEFIHPASGIGALVAVIIYDALQLWRGR